MRARPEEVLDLHAKLASSLTTADQHVSGYFRWFIQDTWEKDKRGDAAYLFYPLLRKGRKRALPEDGRMLARLIGAGVKNAETYQVTAEMVQVMKATWNATMSGKLYHLDRRELPSEAGFAWLDESWSMLDIHGADNQVRAISWEYTSLRFKGDLEDARRFREKAGDSSVSPLETEIRRITGWEMWPAARITLWSLVDDDRKKSLTGPYAGKITDVHWDYAESRLGKLTMLHTAVLPFDMRWALPAPDSAKEMTEVDSVAGLIHMLWMFLGMEIVAKERAPIQRHFRRRAMRSIKHGEVHVVLLRRLAHPSDPDLEAGHRDVDWSCTWVVQGHWYHWPGQGEHGPHRAVVPYGEEVAEEHPAECFDRDLLHKKPHRHCLQCGGRVSWRKPYIKGPDGMPLKVSRTLLKLAR